MAEAKREGQAYQEMVVMFTEVAVGLYLGESVMAPYCVVGYK